MEGSGEVIRSSSLNKYMRVGSSASSDGFSVPGLTPSPIVTSVVNINMNNATTNTNPVDEFAYISGIFFVCGFGQFGTFGLGASVRGLGTVKEMSRKERRNGRRSDDEDKESEKKERRASRERPISSESVDGAYDDAEQDDVLDEARYRKRQNKLDSASIKQFSYPIRTIEEVMADGHGRPDDWDDVITRYESGGAEADAGSEMAGGAAEQGVQGMSSRRRRRRRQMRRQ
ncbi:hypothetical protein CVT25_012149 [Psilocybe cyanescens]|uniref:Uncharacterized protein n=1 Tax=Psilocybe cyanescens TaxID=93625 RepID=A0A409XH65_PSICY|nr:hypothetical protein CVT25_012149 [Psilocybe cyanescens]